MTLQLRAPDGTYAGPIVVAEKEHGERAIVGIKAGAKLGRIEVNPADGYAELATRLPASTSTSSARPSPSREPRWAPATSAESACPPAAAHRETVTSTGSRTRSTSMTTATSSSTASIPSPGPPPSALQRLHPAAWSAPSLLDLDLPDAVNANAPGLTEEQIEAALPSAGRLLLGSLGIETDATSDPPVELDCGDPDAGLIYCRRNGSTGTITSVSIVPPGGGPATRSPNAAIPTKTASARSFGRRSRATAPTRTRSRCGTERPATRSEPATS